MPAGARPAAGPPPDRLPRGRRPGSTDLSTPTVQALLEPTLLPPVPPEVAYYYGLHDHGHDGFLPVRQAAEQQGVTVDELLRMVDKGWLSARGQGAGLRVRPAAIARRIQ